MPARRPADPAVPSVPRRAARSVAAAALLLALAAPARAQDAAPTSAGWGAQPPATAFVGVDVVPMDGEGERVLRDRTVVVRGERIEAVGPRAEVEVPADARVVDGAGRWLIPGLAEMHGHVPPPSAPAQATEDVLFLYLASGITTVRGMLGAPGQLALRERARTGAVVSPTLYLAGPSFNGNSVSSPAQAEAMARAQAAEGWDLLKVHPGLTRAEYDAMARAAHETEMRFGGHVPADVGLTHALEMGQETFDHVDGYLEHLDGYEGEVDDAELATIVEATREAGAWIVPTQALWETLFGAIPLDTLLAYPELRYVSAGQVEGWANAYRQRAQNPQWSPDLARRVAENRTLVLAALHRGGVPILMGTDAPQQFSVPGFSLHREFPRMTAAGMSPYEVLRSGTENVGRYFAEQDRFGSVAPGMRADLVLLAADPLADVANLSSIAGVMARGRWMGAEEIGRRLEAVAERARGSGGA